MFNKMKKISFFACLLSVGMMFTACSSDDSDFNPKTEGEETQTVTFEGSYWDALIDAPQYNGPLLYGENAKNYSWTDATTQLSSSLTLAWGGTYGFAEGGIAISNYIDANISEARSYTDQLAVPTGNGSKNFAVVYCDASISFADAQAHSIKSMDVIGTTYLLGVIKNGDGYAKAMVEKGDYVNVIVTGYKGNEVTGTLKIALAKDGGFVENWTTVDMTSLGKVDAVKFEMESNDVSAYGMKAPKYFALDNVVIKK
jgi:hypothetical protein